jgi:hypothetical protein
MPTYREHCKFLDKDPYALNWVLLSDGKPIGNMYESHLHEIAIHLLKKYNYLVVEILKIVLDVTKIMNKRVFFNVNPEDKRLKSLLTKHCRLIQHTYENIY